MESRGTFILGFCLLLLFLDYSNSLKTKSKGNKNNSTTSPVIKVHNKNARNASSISGAGDTEIVKNLTARILQITSPFSNNDVTIISKPYNSDVIVGQDINKEARVILECSAPFPVQWIYNGDGMPEISTNTSIGNNDKSVKAQNTNHFVATAALGFNRNLQETDTGEYVCRSVQNAEESIYYFIYVPGKSLFTSKTGQTLKVSSSQPEVRIPCSVTNPEVVVTLQKKVNGILQCPMGSLISFHPKSGFLVSFQDGFDDASTDITGEYICIGSLNGSYQLLQYSLALNRLGGYFAKGKEFILSEDAIFYEGDEDDSAEPLGRDEYFSKYDDLCFNTPCGPNSVCRKLPGIRLAMCACKEGYSGSPPKCQLSKKMACDPNPCGPNSQCDEIPGKVKNLPRCSCLPAYIGRPPNCRPECLLNLDCPPTMACINQQCEDPCEDYCAEGAICKVRNHAPVCSCPPGYSGDPRKAGKCGKTRVPSITYFPPRPSYPDAADSSSGESESNESTYNNNPCHPWPCGKFSECRPVGENAHCSCTRGYAGRPPNCYRPECQRNSDCPTSTACIEYKCQDPCLSTSSYKCGVRAMCMTINHNPECYCPSGFYGDPLLRCTPQKPHNGGQAQGQGQGSNSFPESPASSEQAYPPQNNQRPVIVVSGTGGSRPVTGESSGRPQRPPQSPSSPSNSQQIQNQQPGKSPCRNSPCGKNAVCTYRNQTVGCKCPAELAGFGSDPYIECYPAANPCEQCGPNSECRIMKNRQPICSCLPGKVGTPPNCRSNFCGRNRDCPENQSCEKSKCIDPCRRSNCGENSICRPMKHLAVCACPNAPDRDPLLGCPPRRSTQYVEFSFESK